MAEARERAAWDRTAALLALLANLHRDPHRQRALTPADFHPHAAQRAAPLPTADLSILKAVFVDRDRAPTA